MRDYTVSAELWMWCKIYTPDKDRQLPTCCIHWGELLLLQCSGREKRKGASHPKIQGHWKASYSWSWMEFKEGCALDSDEPLFIMDEHCHVNSQFQSYSFCSVRARIFALADHVDLMLTKTVKTATIHKLEMHLCWSSSSLFLSTEYWLIISTMWFNLIQQHQNNLRVRSSQA